MKKNEMIMNPKKGILVVYEGISGSGKSEGIHNLRNYLSVLGFTTRTIEWNDNRVIRKIVKKLIKLGLLTPAVYSFFQWISFLVDYFSVIVPSLQKNQIVLADRYIYTGLSRDAVNGAGTLFGRVLNRLVRKPDLVIFYDTPTNICYERIRSRGKPLFYPSKLDHSRKSTQEAQSFDENAIKQYLVKMRSEYIRILGQLQKHQRTNLLIVKHDKMNSHPFIEQYIYRKKGFGTSEKCNECALIIKK